MYVSVSPYADFRQHLAKYMDEAWKTRAPIRVTRQNARSVIVLSEDERDGMMETIQLLRRPANAERLLRSIKAAEGGELTERELAKPARDE